MPTREEGLAKQTHKEDGLDVGRRVFYTLTEDRNTSREMLQVQRNSKAIALLFKLLVEDGTLTEAIVCAMQISYRLGITCKLELSYEMHIRYHRGRHDHP